MTFNDIQSFLATTVIGKTESKKNELIAYHVVNNCKVPEDPEDPERKFTRRVYHISNKVVCRKRFLEIAQIGTTKLCEIEKYGVNDDGVILTPHNMAKLAKKGKKSDLSEPNAEKRKEVCKFFMKFKSGLTAEHDPSKKGDSFFRFASV